MNIIEAFQSGLPCRRANNAERRTWLFNRYEMDNHKYGLIKEDVLADDWEVKEETKSFTKSEILTALWKAAGDQPAGSKWNELTGNVHDYEMKAKHINNIINDMFKDK